MEEFSKPPSPRTNFVDLTDDSPARKKDWPDVQSVPPELLEDGAIPKCLPSSREELR